MYGWNDRRSVAESTYTENDVKIYVIGKWTVGIHPDGKVEYAATYGSRTDPRSTFENMTIEDGEMRIPITDMVGEVLKRCDQVDLAKSLWSDDNVKEAFMDALKHSFGDGIDDSDRRKFLLKVKENIHNQSVGALENTLSTLERSFVQITWSLFEAAAVNRILESYEMDLMSRFNVQDIKLPRVTTPREAEMDFSSYGGNVWKEARDHWRKKIEEKFPGPVDSEEATKDETL